MRVIEKISYRVILLFTGVMVAMTSMIKSVFADSASSPLTISVKVSDKPVDKILSEIELQTGYGDNLPYILIGLGICVIGLIVLFVIRGSKDRKEV